MCVSVLFVGLLFSMNPSKEKRREKKAKQSEQHYGGLIGFLLSRIYYESREKEKEKNFSS